MNEWTPKGNELVMVGERGPLRAIPQGPVPARCALFDDGTGAYVGEVPTAWLTPAPEPVPDEPTAFGALVRDGEGRLWICNPFDGLNPTWDTQGGPSRDWPDIPRPITVVLADPAEVEKLRAERDEALRRERVAQENAESRLQSAMKATDRADELQRRIDKALGWAADSIPLRRILQGES